MVKKSLENPDDYLILNTSTGESYEINATGKRILDYCNGSLTKDEIARKLVELDRKDTNGSGERVSIEDVIEYIQTLLEEQILDEMVDE